MFADDLTLLSRLKNGLDRMLKLLYDYGFLWRITFNQTKTVTMVFGEKTMDSQRGTLMGEFGHLVIFNFVRKLFGRIWVKSGM